MDPRPTSWLLIQALELLVLVPALLLWMPDAWPRGVRIAVWVLAVMIVTVGNFLFIRSRSDPEGSRSLDRARGPARDR